MKLLLPVAWLIILSQFLLGSNLTTFLPTIAKVFLV